MAVYEYLCSTCQKEFELIRPMSEAGNPAECPRCGSKAKRIISSLGSRTEDSSQVTRQPSRNASAARTPTGKAKIAKTTKRRTASKAVSVLERRSGWHGDPSEDIFKEEIDLWRSTSGTTVHITAVLDDGTAVDSEVDSRQAAIPIEMSWLAEYQPSGSNLWFIHDWGIASVLGYLRDRVETEPAERRLYLEETMGTKLAEADGYHHRVLDQQSVVSIEPVVAASPAEATDSYLIASERRSAISVRPWPEEIAMEPAEADTDYADLASEQADVPGVKPRPDEATVDHTQATEPDSQPAEEQAADPSRRPSLTKGRMETDFPDQIIKAAWRRQGGRCARCGRWLIWPYRDRDSGTGAWQSHRRIPEDQGGGATLGNCVLLCSGVGNCHFNVGHGGIAWSHYAQLDDSVLLFLVDVSITAADPTAPTRPKRSLLKAVLGISQSK
jgi:putative FmdB family regulatory protein